MSGPAAVLAGLTTPDLYRWTNATDPAQVDNFDALGDHLDEVPPGDPSGVVVLWDGWSPLARHDEQAFRVALSVLGARVNAERGAPFVVLLRAEGPTLDLAELPVRA